MLPVRSWCGLGGSAGGSVWGGIDRLWGNGTGLRGLSLTKTLYGGGVLFSLRMGSSELLEREVGNVVGGASGWGGGWSDVGNSVPDASDTLQRLREEMPLL